MEQGEIEVLLELGQSYLLNKEYDQAIKKFSEALKINPHDPELYYNLGLAYEGAKRPSDAVTMYEKTLQLDRTFSNAEIRLDKLNEKPVEIEKETIETEGIILKKKRKIAASKNKKTTKPDKKVKKKTRGTKKKAK
ncbi:MAG: tetratricopeptide repeat protein [bacterium]